MRVHGCFRLDSSRVLQGYRLSHAYWLGAIWGKRAPKPEESSGRQWPLFSIILLARPDAMAGKGP